MKYTAMIVEPRRHKAIEFVLKNALECLNEDWKIIFFHGNNNKDYVTNIVQRLGSSRIEIIHLPIDNLTLTQYSSLFARKSVIYNFLTEIFLVFQTDSMMFVQNKDMLNKFLEYDYVGGPWRRPGCHLSKECGHIGNGGFSLRRKNKMLEIIEKVKWEYNNEDLYFCKNYPNIHVNKPPYELAMTFSVEAIFSEITFACHKPWIEDHYHQFKLYYPEVEELRLLQATE
jgi:hypothetical protein